MIVGAAPSFRCALAAGVAVALWAPEATAESAYCRGLRAQIAHSGGGSDRYAASAGRQQLELNRTIAYARSLGCDRQQFLFFGEAPPPQCGQINARIGRMRANLAVLQQKSDEGRRSALLARYDAQCREAPANPASRSFLDELFNIGSPRNAELMREPPVESGDPFGDEQPRKQANEGEHVGGDQAVCVRQCDGAFFPLSYSARRADLGELDSLCKALCPNAETTLYTKALWGDIESAVSIDGESYLDHPNALKFQKTRVPKCGCKPPDKTWAEALVEAERILAASHSKDTMVSAEQAEQLSRPIAPNNAQSREEAKTGSRDAQSSDPAASAARREPSVIRESVGPDGAARRVRVIAPTL